MRALRYSSCGVCCRLQVRAIHTPAKGNDSFCTPFCWLQQVGWCTQRWILVGCSSWIKGELLSNNETENIPSAVEHKHTLRPSPYALSPPSPSRTATFERGDGDTFEREYDMFVGADGVNSRVRKSLEDNVPGFTVRQKEVRALASRLEIFVFRLWPGLLLQSASTREICGAPPTTHASASRWVVFMKPNAWLATRLR